MHMVLSRVSPLAVPVLLEIGRESVGRGEDEERLLAEAEAIIAEATGGAVRHHRPMQCAGGRRKRRCSVHDGMRGPLPPTPSRKGRGGLRTHKNPPSPCGEGVGGRGPCSP